MSNERFEYLDSVYGIIFSISVFFYICGVDILNPFNSDWILKHGADPANYTIFWYFYRNAEWSFPLTLFNTASYPYWQTCFIADICPLFAIPFKLISKLFFSNDSQFHYFGILLLFNFIMQSVCGTILLRTCIKNKLTICSGTMILVLSPAMLYSMPVHMAGSSHWIILLALVPLFKKVSLTKQWLITIIAMFINPYLYFMALVIISSNQIREWIKENNISGDLYFDCKNVFKLISKMFLGFCINISGLYLIGYFSIKTSNSLGKCSMLSANLNTFINPLDCQFSNLIQPMPIAISLQYDGFAYIGAGIILGYILLSTLIFKTVFSYKWINDNKIILLMTLFFIIFAISRIICIGNIHLISINLPAFIETFYAQFRSCGRMIWVVYYLAILCLCIAIDKTNIKIKPLIIFLLLSIQLYDLGYGTGGILNYKWNEFYTLKNSSIKTDYEELNDIKDKKHIFICYPPDYNSKNDKFYILVREIALQNKTINNFNFGRKNILCDLFYIKNKDEKTRINDNNYLYLNINNWK